MSHLEQMTKLYLDSKNEINSLKAEIERLTLENKALKLKNNSKPKKRVSFSEQIENTQKESQNDPQNTWPTDDPKDIPKMCTAITVSDTFSKFFDLPKGYLISRDEARRLVLQYAYQRNLVINDEWILPHDPLCMLLGLPLKTSFPIKSVSVFLKPHCFDAE